MKRPLSALLLLLALPLLSSSAEAIRCNEWNRLGPQQKTAAVQGLIDDLASNNRVRQTSVNPVTLQRCLESRIGWILDDFDATCAESASLQALNRVFREHAWSCVR